MEGNTAPKLLPFDFKTYKGKRGRPRGKTFSQLDMMSLRREIALEVFREMLEEFAESEGDLICKDASPAELLRQLASKLDLK